MRGDQIFCAVQVPEHIAPRQVPDPEVPERWPKPTARLISLRSVTLTTPASATWPAALTAASLDAILPLLMPIESVAPLPHSDEEDAMWTLHSPSKVAALACAANATARSNATVSLVLQDCPMTSPLCLRRTRLARRVAGNRDGSHVAGKERNFVRTVLARQAT